MVVRSTPKLTHCPLICSVQILWQYSVIWQCCANYHIKWWRGNLSQIAPSVVVCYCTMHQQFVWQSKLNRDVITEMSCQSEHLWLTDFSSVSMLTENLILSSSQSWLLVPDCALPDWSRLRKTMRKQIRNSISVNADGHLTYCQLWNAQWDCQLRLTYCKDWSLTAWSQPAAVWQYSVELSLRNPDWVAEQHWHWEVNLTLIRWWQWPSAAQFTMPVLAQSVSSQVISGDVSQMLISETEPTFLICSVSSNWIWLQCLSVLMPKPEARS